MSSLPLPPLDRIQHVHIIGVCGTLMGSFAAYLKRRNIRVTGSDQNIYPPMSDVLKAAQVELLEGYRPENLMATGRLPDLVVIGNVITRANPEAAEAIGGSYAYTSLPEAMERLFLPATRNLVVAGTHGKTTTSSLLTHVLVKAGRDPSYFIGGVSPDLPNSFHVAGIEKGRCFVLEGDEYDTAFWDKVPKFNHYLPDDVILTSIEYDHADIYPDFAAVRRAFEGLLTRIRPGGRLIACVDYPVIGELIRQAGSTSVLTYGFQAGAVFRPDNLVSNADGVRFDVLKSEKKVAEAFIRLPGAHNVLNALSVWILCSELGLSMQQILEGFRSFQGVKRRQEVRGEIGGVTVIDDFAHHPTAVRETLKALRAKYAGRRLISVFEPRSATSRRKVFQKDYTEAFALSDETFVAMPHDQTKIEAANQFSSQELVSDLKVQGHEAHVMATVEAGVTEVAARARAGDVIAVLSNGGFGGFIPKLLEALKR